MLFSFADYIWNDPHTPQRHVELLRKDQSRAVALEDHSSRRRFGARPVPPGPPAPSRPFWAAAAAALSLPWRGRWGRCRRPYPELSLQLFEVDGPAAVRVPRVEPAMRFGGSDCDGGVQGRPSTDICMVHGARATGRRDSETRADLKPISSQASGATGQKVLGVGVGGAFARLSRAAKLTVNSSLPCRRPGRAWASPCGTRRGTPPRRCPCPTRGRGP